MYSVSKKCSGLVQCTIKNKFLFLLTYRYMPVVFILFKKNINLLKFLFFILFSSIYAKKVKNFKYLFLLIFKQCCSVKTKVCLWNIPFKTFGRYCKDCRLPRKHNVDQSCFDYIRKMVCSLGHFCIVQSPTSQFTNYYIYFYTFEYMPIDYSVSHFGQLRLEKHIDRVLN